MTVFSGMSRNKLSTWSCDWLTLFKAGKRMQTPMSRALAENASNIMKVLVFSLVLLMKLFTK